MRALFLLIALFAFPLRASAETSNPKRGDSCIPRSGEPLPSYLSLRDLGPIYCPPDIENTPPQVWTPSPADGDAEVINPMYLAGQSVRVVSCAKPNGNVSPEEYERPKYFARRSGNIVFIPMNISCIIHRYPDAELEKWINNGDPVALYAQTVKIYNISKNYCENDVVNRLSKIYAFQIKNGDSILHRIPEAYTVIQKINYECNRPSTYFDPNDSYQHGYDKRKMEPFPSRTD